MKRLLIFALAISFSAPMYAQTMSHDEMSHDEMSHDGMTHNAAPAVLTLAGATRRTLSQSELQEAETGRTKPAKANGAHLFYEADEVRLVVRTGPEDDMLSYRIEGQRNPMIHIAPGATLRVLFVNTDSDMPHDIRFDTRRPPFEIAPAVGQSVGSDKLPHQENETFSAQELTLKAPSADGHFTYFCSVRGHAKGGMFGTLMVGKSDGAHSMHSSPDASTQGSMNHGMMHGDMKSGEKMMCPMCGHAMTPDAKNGHPRDEKMHGMKCEHCGHTMPMHGAMPMHDMKNCPMCKAMSTHGSMAMASSVDLTDPMARQSSGTSWQPDSSPIYAKMKMKGDAMLMLHGSIFPRFTKIGSKRDVSVAGKGSRSRVDAPSMFMAMYSKPLDKEKKSQLGLHLMASLDPLIERGYGYPLLFQSGETYKKQPLHDRQHPHDFISELSATYSRKIGKNSLSLYFGYPGEPALGPPAFMHRVSAMDNPDAPISHHWQDATHITWGVATAGYSFGKWKIEGSAFKGEEPDENRYNFDKLRLDSHSVRLSWNPTKNLSLQVSRGVLKNPEPSEPSIKKLTRTTASVLFNKPLGRDANWSNAFVWGQNDIPGEGKSNAFLLESNYQRGANTFYGRIERVQKSGHELSLGGPLSHGLFNVTSYSVGYVRDLKRNNGYDVGVGAQVTFGTNPSSLASIYGGKSHTGFQVFLRLRPSRLRMDETHSMNMDDSSASHSGHAMPMNDGKEMHH